MLTVGFAEEPRVKPVMVGEKSWMESRSAGFGGFAVSTTETVAVPPPQLTTQPPPGTPLQDARRSAETNRSAAAETLRIMDYPVIPKFWRAGDENRRSQTTTPQRIYSGWRGFKSPMRATLFNF